MKFNLHQARQLARVGITVLVLLTASCSGQTPNAVAPQATDQGAVPIIPNTGLATATPPMATQAGATQLSQAQSATTPPACTKPATLTPAATEGPFFKANSPKRSSLVEANTSGTRLTLTGYVLTADCKPVANAQLDFWQANAQGAYDNTGYALRGHQFTGADGRYQLDTIVPGLYTGRTEHIHVKVQAPNGPILTTQLFFPGVADNPSDSIYNPALLINVLDDKESMQATFDFIIATQ